MLGNFPLVNSRVLGFWSLVIADSLVPTHLVDPYHPWKIDRKPSFSPSQP